MTGRWLVMVIVAFALIAAGLVEGIVQRTLMADSTGLVWLICVVTVVGTVASHWWSWLNFWITEQGITVMLGLLGTVIGFMWAIEGAVSGDVASKLSGVETALATTATGIVAHVHLLVMQMVMRNQ